MSMRLMGGEQGTFLETTCLPIATYVATTPAVGDLVIVSTSNNWAVNSAAATSSLAANMGRISKVEDDLSAVTVQWWAFNKVVECTYSATPTLGQTIRAQTNNKVQTSNCDGVQEQLCKAVAYDSPTSGKVYFMLK